MGSTGWLDQVLSAAKSGEDGARMGEKSFWDHYRDPRWQRRRLEIMQRDCFCCSECDSDDKTLNVHHRHYLPAKKPWEYEDDDLTTLCAECHARVGENKKELSVSFGRMTISIQDEICGYSAACAAARDGIPFVIKSLAFLVGIFNFYRIVIQPADFHEWSWLVGMEQSDDFFRPISPRFHPNTIAEILRLTQSVSPPSEEK
jgi:hypothetical protein